MMDCQYWSHRALVELGVKIEPLFFQRVQSAALRHAAELVDDRGGDNCEYHKEPLIELADKLERNVP